MLPLDNDLMSEAMMGVEVQTTVVGMVTGVGVVVGVAAGNEQLTGATIGVSGSSFDSPSVGFALEGVSCSWLSVGL